jgi:FkbM family methyltransferase
MLIPLHDLVKKYNIQFRGILHVGAHECEELVDYEKYVTRDKILWVEALPDKVAICSENYPGVLIRQAVASDTVENVKFYVSNNGQSSSILELGLHKYFHPQIHYIGHYVFQTQLLKNILCDYNIDYNFLNFDIQGAELKALKGMESYLSKVDYLYTEVNSAYVYKGCALITELDEYLKQFDLHRVETEWSGENRWGDAFYIRSSCR